MLSLISKCVCKCVVVVVKSEYLIENKIILVTSKGSKKLKLVHNFIFKKLSSKIYFSKHENLFTDLLKTKLR